MRKDSGIPYQKSTSGSISLFGVPNSHSLARGTRSSWGSLVNSNFFFVKSRYFEETYCQKAVLVSVPFQTNLLFATETLSGSLWPAPLFLQHRVSKGRLTCMRYGFTSSPSLTSKILSFIMVSTLTHMPAQHCFSQGRLLDKRLKSAQ